MKTSEQVAHTLIYALEKLGQFNLKEQNEVFNTFLPHYGSNVFIIRGLTNLINRKKL